VIDLATWKEIKRVDLSPMQRPHGIVARGGKVYFTVEDTTARWTHPSATRPPELRPPNGEVSSYDPSGQGGFSWSTGEYGTHMLVISEDGKKIFTTNIQSNSVSVWEREGTAGPQGTTIPVGKGPEGIDMSSDGAKFGLRIRRTAASPSLTWAPRRWCRRFPYRPSVPTA